MPPIVAPKPYCRKCGATVKALEKCPRCGKRAMPSLLSLGSWAKH